MAAFDCVAVVLAGGSGTRFWPLSRKDHPKQYLSLFGKRTLIQETVERILPSIPPESIFVCTTRSQEALLREQLPEIGNRIFEPEGKNTAAAMMLSAAQLLRCGYSRTTVMAALPADHYIANATAFREALARSAAFARESGGLVTLGINPVSPHTGYGYIEADRGTRPSSGFYPVKRFREKPDRHTAEQFLKNGSFYWNSGIFIWTLGAITDAFQTFMRESWERLAHFKSEEDLQAIYREIRPTPIDIGILEKAPNVFVLPAEMGWSDVGSWDALLHLHPSSQGNVLLSGEMEPIQSRGCLVRVESGKKVALVGVEDLIIVESGDTLLIAHRDHDQLVREAAKKFDS